MILKGVNWSHRHWDAKPLRKDYTYMQNRAEKAKILEGNTKILKKFRKVENQSFFHNQSFKINILYMKIIRKLCAL